ncbi:hypothetical protein BS78_10G179600 [Paspalum vaginatum]|nr:hypothetical protein BS78_10G179600 [Paspalum vaginatum]
MTVDGLQVTTSNSTPWQQGSSCKSLRMNRADSRGGRRCFAQTYYRWTRWAMEASAQGNPIRHGHQHLEEGTSWCRRTVGVGGRDKTG